MFLFNKFYQLVFHPIDETYEKEREYAQPYSGSNKKKREMSKRVKKGLRTTQKVNIPTITRKKQHNYKSPININYNSKRKNENLFFCLSND